MMLNTLQKNKVKNGGYTLLFAVLVSSLVLAIAVSILNISKKEFLLAASSRDSSSAFYAADSGIECAVYGEFERDAFNMGEDRTGYLGCNFGAGGPFFYNKPTFPASVGVFHFHFRPSAESTSCAVVDVLKIVSPAQTMIDSRGYNSGWNSSNNKCETPSAKRVERAIHIKY